jgi:hypothetical protein
MSTQNFITARCSTFSANVPFFLVLTLHLLNLKSQSFEMAKKSGFEALKTGSALLKKKDVCGKGGAAGGDKVLRGYRKNVNRYAQVLKTVRET